MDLLKRVNKIKKEYVTDSYPMSIGEIVNLYVDGEIDINPDFQRYYRWSKIQKSKFIESLLLGIPTPSIFVYQTPEGIWELVDGLQRISTILEFMGKLKSKGDKNKTKPPLKLEGTNLLPSLEGVMWKHPKSNKLSLQTQLQLQIKREKIPVQIIQNTSDPEAKFEVFQRLNTGGSFLSPQEVRNCLLVMLDKKLYSWLKILSNNEDFSNCISISQRLVQQQYDMELVLRYLACSIFEYDRKDVEQYLTNSLLKISKMNDFDYKLEKKKFLKLFEILNKSLGDKTFKKFDGNKFGGKFLESAFEAITIGIGHNLDSYSIDDKKTVISNIKEMWSNNTFLKYSGSGSNAKTRIPNLIPFSKRFFANG